jgi:two-component system CheB/CheR fusion protein
MSELGQTNDDLHNVLVGLENATIIVGMDLRIRRFTASAERLLNMVPADVGRSISFLDTFTGVDFRAKVSQVIDTLASVEEDILSRNQRWYSLRITPYKTLDHAIRGAVITLADIDARKRSAALTRDVGEYAGKFLAAINHPLLILDNRFRIVWANDSYYERFNVVPQETIGNIFPSSGDPLSTGGKVRERLEETLRTGEAFREYEVPLRLPTDGERKVKLGASLVPVATESALILVSIED